MKEQRSIITEWLSGKSNTQRSNIIGSMGDHFANPESLPMEGVLEQLAVCILASCAKDLGLSTMELTGLLIDSRQEALNGLVTVIHGDG